MLDQHFTPPSHTFRRFLNKINAINHLNKMYDIFTQNLSLYKCYIYTLYILSALIHYASSENLTVLKVCAFSPDEPSTCDVTSDMD